MGRIKTVKRMKTVELNMKILSIPESNNRVQDNLAVRFLNMIKGLQDGQNKDNENDEIG